MLKEKELHIPHRRFVVGWSSSTNTLSHALRLIERGYGKELGDDRPEPKYRWLKEDILEARH